VWDHRNRQGRIRGETYALIAAAFIFLFAILAWGPWNDWHVAVNPGPSGTPGSTAVHETPPPAVGASGKTTGSAP
jgi:hypothetical protein